MQRYGSTTKRLTRVALMTAAALLLHLVEAMLPPLFPAAPGAKLGLSNLVTMMALVLLGYADAFAVLLIRCLLGSVFAGNVSSLMYALPAGIAAFGVQALLYALLWRVISLPTLGLIGAVVHNTVQVCVASLAVRTFLWGLLPFMAAAGAVAGVCMGLITWLTVKYLPPRVYKEV